MENKELHIAPMLNYSYRDFRALLRILSKRAVLWTEMVVDETIANARELEKHLGYDTAEHPIVCQLGGNCPDLAGQCANIIAQEYGYDEININCECPSDKVAKQREFGAALMKKPELVKSMIIAMKGQMDVNIPVSVKTRIGIMGEDDQLIYNFITTLQPVCKKFILHARQVHLNGLNARQNRNVPPLNYAFVYELCRAFPDCEFNINGGIKSLEEARRLCHRESHDDGTTAPPNLRGCMLGRLAVENPSLFWDVDRYFYGELENPCRTRREVLVKYVQYLERAYPRRCCDDDERVTYLYPPPRVAVPLYTYCAVCEGVYRDTIDQFEDGLQLCTLETEPRLCSSDAGTSNSSRKEQFQRRCPGIKMSSRMIGRALRPVEKLFIGMPCSKTFRLAMQEKASHNNCGPGFVLRSVIQSTPYQYLDEPFLKTGENRPSRSFIKKRDASNNATTNPEKA